MDVGLLQTMVTNWQQALYTDSISPQPSYSIDGQNVSREQWRAGMWKMIIEANQMINMLSPFIVTTKQVM